MTTQHYPSPAGTGADPFHRGLADCARRVLRSARGLSRADRQLCYDVQRGKYAAAWFARFLGLAARCDDDADRHAIDEHARGYVVMERAHVVPMGVSAAPRRGSRSRSPRRGSTSRSSPTCGTRALATYEALYDAAVAQMEATRRLIDATRAEQAARTPRAPPRAPHLTRAGKQQSPLALERERAEC
jgi:hypothetical protein